MKALFSQLCVRGRSADFQSAVSPNCIRKGVGAVPRVGLFRRDADYKSAIRQSATLRYESGAKHILSPSWDYNGAAGGKKSAYRRTDSSR